MAESVSRRDALLEAWAEWMDGDDDEGPVIEPPNYYFEAGFNAAWDMLLSEISPLVDDVLSAHPQGDAHFESSKRLRELIRETEQ